jgi:outer membrane protein OmpA-like peptidoglycan-associated protein
MGYESKHRGHVGRRGAARPAGAVLASALVALALVMVPSLVEPAAAASAKITICHRTHSTTNPYRRITVSQNAVTNARHGGHKVPNGSSNPAVYDSTFTYASNNKIWGDIIPGSTSGGSAYNGSASIALNWTTAGIAAFSNNCASMTAKAYYDSEIAAGETAQNIVDDLNEQSANEDAALLASIGGSFTTSNATSWDTAVSVSTSAASSVLATTATLNGSITVGNISTAIGFDYGTSSTLASFTSVSAGSNVTSVTSQAISKALTGLSSATTYYFRATGTTNAGTDTEGILYGSITSFTTPGSTAQSITFNQPTDMVLGGGTQTLTNATADTSGLTVTFTSNSTSVCTVSGAVVTAVDAGTCSITASQAGNATYAPATSVTRTFAVTATARTLAIDAGFNGSSYAIDGTAPTVTSTPSAGVGQGTKSYTSSTTGVCTIASATGVVTFVSAGTCTIGAAITAGGSFSSATATTVSFTVTATARTLAIDGGSYNSGGYAFSASPPTITSTPSAGVGQGTKSYSSSTTGVCTVNSTSGVVVFVSTGTCTLGASISAGGGFNSATASTVSFSITAATRTLAIDSGSYSAGGYSISATTPTITSTPSAGSGTKTYSSTTTSVCTIDSSTGAVTFVAPGNCTIGASIAANGAYGSATATTVTFAVSALSRTLAIDSSSYSSSYSTEGGAPTITSTPSAGSGTKTYSSSTPSVCTINASTGAVTFVAAGTCTIGASIAASGNHGVATASAISFTITAPVATPSTTSTTAPPTTTSTVPPTTTTTVPRQVASTPVAAPLTPGRVFELPAGPGEVRTPGGATVRVPIQLIGDQITVGTTTYGLQIKTTGTSTTFAKATITLVKGSNAVISGFGFKGGTIVQIYILSTPTSVGTALVRSDGTYTGTFKVPPGLADGQHSINSVGTLHTGKPATVGAPVTVTSRARRIIIVPFAFDSSTLTPKLRKQVVTAAKIIKEFRITSLTLVGYTDPVGSTGYNVALSRRRAASVNAYLAVSLKALGYSSKEVKRLGLGKSDFVYRSRSTVDAAASRRVVIEFDASR